MDPLNGSASHNVQEISAVLKLSARMRARLSPELLSLRCLAVSSQLQSLITCQSPSQLYEPVFSSTSVPPVSSGEEIENTMRRNGKMCNHSSSATRMLIYGRQDAFAVRGRRDARRTVRPSVNTIAITTGPVIGRNPSCSPLSDSHTIPDSNEVTSFSSNDEKLQSHESPASVCDNTDREMKKHVVQMAECPCGRTFQQLNEMQRDTATSTVEGADSIWKELREIKQRLDSLQRALPLRETEMHRRAPANVAEFFKPSSGPEPAATVADETSKAELVLCTNAQKRRRSSSGHGVEIIPDSQGAAQLHEDDQQGRDRPAKRQRRQ